MPRYRVPTFNLLCSISQPGIAGDPDVLPFLPYRLTGVPCQLTYGRRVNVMSTGGTDTPGIPTKAISVLLPKGTDVRGPQDTISFDMIEVPEGTGRWYQVFFVDDVGKGFANEHREAGAFAVFGSWGAPYP